MKCPCCGSELTEIYRHASEWGTEESQYSCPQKCYTETFAYGSTQIDILGFMTGYHYTTPREEVEQIHKQIKTFAACHKLQAENAELRRCLEILLGYHKGSPTELPQGIRKAIGLEYMERFAGQVRARDAVIEAAQRVINGGKLDDYTVLEKALQNYGEAKG